MPTAMLGTRRKLLGAMSAFAVVCTFAAGCGGSSGSSASSGGSGGGGGSAPSSVTIAYQPGISYAPLIVLKQQKKLEQQFPNTKVTWKILSSGAAITDGMLSGDIQIGAGGVGPLILDWSKGVDVKYISSMNDADLWLMAKDPSIKSLKDLKGKGKIAMPSPTSIQSVILRKGAEQQLGDAHALDSQIVAMSHPDGVQNLVSGQIAAHLTSPPFEFTEQDNGAHVVLHSKDLFGTSTFNGEFTTTKFYNAHKAFVQKFYNDIKDAISTLKNDPKTGAEMLSKDAGGTPSADQFQKWITNPAIQYTDVPHGLMKFATFMKSIGMISKAPSSWKDLVFPTVQGTNGS